MDTGVVPAPGSFEVLLDGVPQTPTGASWIDSTKLKLDITASAAATAFVKLLTVDTNLRNADEVIAVAPQIQQVL